LQFHWMEAITNAELIIQDRKVPLLIAQNRFSASLYTMRIKQWMGQNQQVPFQLLIRDQAGNQSRMFGNLVYKPRPLASPQLTIGNGDSLIKINKITSLMVNADRKLYQWKVILDGKEQKLLPEKTPLKARQKILIPRIAFSQLEDGLHQLQVLAVDDFALLGKQTLDIFLDRKAPQIQKLSKKLSLNKIKLDKGENLSIVWDEPLSRVEVLLEKKAWPAVLSTDKKTLIINGDPGKLDFKLKPLQIIVYDEVGNRTKINGKLALKIPRELALRNNHRDTILKKGLLVSNQVMLTSRPGFSLNKSKPLKNSENVEKLEKLKYKKRSFSRIHGSLNDSFLNSF